MVYHGRIIVTGFTGLGEPFAAYAISGRSQMSKKRELRVTGPETLYVDSLGQRTLEQERLADLIFYNAMHVKNDKLIVTNGAQTDVKMKDGQKIPNFYDNFEGKDPIRETDAIMSAWGHENDPPFFTPRTALVRFPGQEAYFSIATKYQDGSGVGTIRIEIGNPRGLATYRAQNDEAASWSIPNSGHLYACTIAPDVGGNSTQDIARSLYEFLDPRFAVASVAAVFRNGIWEIGTPLNRYRDEEDFLQQEGAHK